MKNQKNESEEIEKLSQDEDFKFVASFTEEEREEIEKLSQSQ